MMKLKELMEEALEEIEGKHEEWVLFSPAEHTQEKSEGIVIFVLKTSDWDKWNTAVEALEIKGFCRVPPDVPKRSDEFRLRWKSPDA